MKQIFMVKMFLNHWLSLLFSSEQSIKKDVIVGFFFYQISSLTLEQ